VVAVVLEVSRFKSRGDGKSSCMLELANGKLSEFVH
jgi:hypothetical protein